MVTENKGCSDDFFIIRWASKNIRPLNFKNYTGSLLLEGLEKEEYQQLSAKVFVVDLP